MKEKIFRIILVLAYLVLPAEVLLMTTPLANRVIEFITIATAGLVFVGGVRIFIRAYWITRNDTNESFFN